MSKNKVISNSDAIDAFKLLAQEFAIVHNPSFVHPEYEFYPLAPQSLESVESIEALVMDMDGTTTSTEELCIFSLEMMVRRVTARLTKDLWEGINHHSDLPYIIGNSTTKHVEYLLDKYGAETDQQSFTFFFWYSAIWTFRFGSDAGRKKEISITLTSLGYPSFSTYSAIEAFQQKVISDSDIIVLATQLSQEHPIFPNALEHALFIRICVDIYYTVYHQILGCLHTGDTKFLELVFGLKITTGFIKPMPGIGYFLALVKGLLGNNAGELFFQIGFPGIDDLVMEYGGKQFLSEKLNRISAEFAKAPTKIAVVTSSISFEAQIVLEQVFKVLRQEIDCWGIDTQTNDDLQKAFSNPTEFYTGVITATDSHEIRLKPHRDLYSIALQTLNIVKENFSKVIGFEDSQSGTLAIRAAGIGKCIAVPFAQTMGHDLSAASLICKHGIPEFILRTGIFLKNV